MQSSYLRILLLVISGGTLSFPALSQTGPATGVPTSAAQPTTAHALRISSGDLIELGVFDTPELSGKLRVSAAGDITIPIAGAMHVSGMTAEEAASAIERRLVSGDILKDPHVSVFMSEYATQGVTVTGEVRNPGIYPLLGGHGVIDLISAAGGWTANAGKAVTLTHKDDPDHPEIVLLDTRPGGVAALVDVRPGDSIAVSRSGVVYVVGDVAKAGGFLIEGNERLTAMQALALAQGANRTAAENKSRILRKTTTGRLEIPLPLKQIVNGKVVDPLLEDGDILYVPSSTAKSATTRSVEAAIALTTGLIIYGRL
jgi:polysaccharide export outer membrane protein